MATPSTYEFSTHSSKKQLIPPRDLPCGRDRLNFSLVQARIHVLWRILQSVRNEEEKNEESKTKFCSFVSQKWLSDFLQIWCVDSSNWPARW